MLTRVKETAELAGISVRTLHHYDEIGLLVPDTITESGHRLYSEINLERLQQILFFKELGFSLERIKRILDSPDFNREEALELQRRMLLEKRSRLDKMIAMIEKTIQYAKGEIVMSNREKFEGFDFSSNPYEQEARERWGDDAVNKANEAVAEMDSEKQNAAAEEMNAIYRKLAQLRGGTPDTVEAQKAIGEWYSFITRFGNYTPEAFKGLGEMYVEDDRFRHNIDRFGEGLAVFMREAMASYADHLDQK
ncbi:MerR family transcriptional regulator [Paenibacillus enshidis]|uniref:MerR family transcriptional regulator n=1 Tax=Paenibacillus enshidis TaxID=1458439 RepID=A0ABV5AWX6_9BACL